MVSIATCAPGVRASTLPRLGYTTRMKAILRATGASLAALCILAGGISYAHAATSSALELMRVRAIRVTDDTISLSFMTSESAVGSVVYTDTDSSTITLTDAEPQVDHLYTIDRLDPKHGYTFTLSATSRANLSNKYVVSLSPETIGQPGASIVPLVQEVTPNGEVVASTLAASTTPEAHAAIPKWVYLLVASLLLLIWALNRYLAQLARKERKKGDAGTSP